MSDHFEDSSNIAEVHSDLAAAFMNVTGCSDGEAQRYLEAVNWDYNLAVGTFFDSQDDFDVHPKPPSEASEPNIGSTLPEIPKSSNQKSLPSDGQSNASSSDVRQSNERRIKTFDSLRGDDNDSNEDEQAFYAGGSVRSGQQIVGPAKRKGSTFVNQMLRSARVHGAEVIDPDDVSNTNPSPSLVRPFSGSGHVLGSSETEKSSAVETNATSSQSDQTEGSVSLFFRAWSNGFTINDGPLQDYHAPENRQLLHAIHNGEVPPEFNNLANGKEVTLFIADHSREEYVPTSNVIAPFSGVGHRLGSPIPQVLDANSPPAGLNATSDSTRPTNVEENERRAAEMLNVDSSAPVTSVQIRLNDGSKLVLKLNHHHTIHDIRQYITIARPQYSASVFDLIVTFPNKRLDDGDTVESANLFNCVLVQKLK